MKKIALLIACAMLFAALITSCMVHPEVDDNAPEKGDGEKIEKTDKDGEYTPGTSTEDGYSSDYLGLEFIPSDNMVMATEEELYEAMGLGADAVGMDKEQMEWADVANSYEMMASDPITGSNVNIIAEKLAFKNITMAQYIEALKGQFASLEGMTVTFVGESETTLAGETYTRLEMSTDYVGIEMTQVMLLRKVDDRMFAITITAMNDGDEEAILSCFKAK